jgi:hypothetical protein
MPTRTYYRQGLTNIERKEKTNQFVNFHVQANRICATKILFIFFEEYADVLNESEPNLPQRKTGGIY